MIQAPGAPKLAAPWIVQFGGKILGAASSNDQYLTGSQPRGSMPDSRRHHTAGGTPLTWIRLLLRESAPGKQGKNKRSHKQRSNRSR